MRSIRSRCLLAFNVGNSDICIEVANMHVLKVLATMLEMKAKVDFSLKWFDLDQK